MNPAFSHARFQASMPEGGWPEAFGVVTACDPDGEPAPGAVNAGATEDLRARLVAEGWAFFPVTGGSADFAHAEPGFGIVAGREEILALGREYRQVAVFWIEGDALTLCPCDEGVPVELGSFLDRVVAKAGEGRGWRDGGEECRLLNIDF